MPPTEPAEFSIEDAMLNTWEEDSGDYLRLDPETVPAEPPPAEPS